MVSSNDIEIDDSIVLEALRRDATADRAGSRQTTLGTQTAMPDAPRRLFAGTSTGATRRPNLRFLNNIIQDTNAHNAALKLRELENAGDRLRVLKGEPPRDLQRAKHDRSRDQGRGRDRRDGWDRDISSRSRSRHRSRKHLRSRSRSTSRSNEERRKRTARHRDRGHERGARKRDASRSRSSSRDRYAHRRRKRSDSPRRRRRRDSVTRSRSQNRHDGRDDARDGSRKADVPRTRPKRHDKGRHNLLDDDHSDDYRSTGSARRKRRRSRYRSLDRSGHTDGRHRDRHGKERNSYRSTSRSTEDTPERPDDAKEMYTNLSIAVPSRSQGKAHSAAQGTASASPRPESTLSPQSRSRSSSIGPSLPNAQSFSNHRIAHDSQPKAHDSAPVTRRGRGTYTTSLSSNAIDQHFSSSYDPRRDIQPGASPPPAGKGKSDDADDWSSSLTALRARDEYRENQKKRLLAAGFSEEEVGRWEKGQGNGRDLGTGAGDEESVRWNKKGEGREWDRGKVVGEDGDVETAVDWSTEGRLV